MSDRGAQGDQGPEGPSGPQGRIGQGTRGERGVPGARGEAGKAGSRTKLPRRVFVAFVGLALTNAATFAFAFHDRTQNINRINEGRRVGMTVTCAFGSAVAEQGRKVIATARPGTPTAERERRRKMGRKYVAGIARAVERDTGFEWLVIREGKKAGQLDCARLLEAVVP